MPTQIGIFAENASGQSIHTIALIVVPVVVWLLSLGLTVWSPIVGSAFQENDYRAS
jgi:hypothetical protein